MVWFRSRRLAAGFFACIAVLGACGGKKEEGKAGEGGGGGTSAAGNKDLDVIPAESDTVFSIDLAKAQQSALFRDLALPMITKSRDVQQVVDVLKTSCNIDPMIAATRLTGGAKMDGDRPSELVAVLHGLEKAKALPCVDKMKDQLAERRVEVTKDGDVVVLKGERGSLAFTFTGDTTAVVVMGDRANKAGVLEVAQGKSMLKTSKEFTDVYSRLQTGHTFWAIAKGDVGSAAQNLERLGFKSRAIYGSANATDGLELRLNIRVESEEQATKLAELIKSQGAMVSGMAQKFDIDRDKSDVRATVVMTQQQLKSILGFLAPMLR